MFDFNLSCYDYFMSTTQFNEFQNKAERKRLLDIAKARTTSTDTIANMIFRAIGEEVEDISRIVRGESNEVYEIKTKKQHDIILRIGHWDKKTFQRESWAIKQASAIGVPVPKILAIGEHQSSTYYCIQEKLRGTTLDTLLYSHNLPKERARVIVEKAGEALGKLHSIHTTGWGYLNEPNQGEFKTLEEKYNKVKAERERIATAIKATNIPITDINNVLQTLSSGLQVHKGHQSLIHGDFGPKHIFVDNKDNITGIIDWEQAESGDPVIEFARWNFWFEKESPTIWLKTGHEKITSLGDNYDERYRIAKLEMAIWTLLYFTYDSPLKERAMRAVKVIAETTR